jgi:hypothetical protein
MRRSVLDCLRRRALLRSNRHQDLALSARDHDTSEHSAFIAGHGAASHAGTSALPSATTMRAQ